MKILFLTFVSLCLLATNADANDFPATDVTSGAGVVVHIYGSWPNYENILDQLQATGARVARIDFLWSMIEQQAHDPGQPAVYDFSGYDNVVAACKARGIRIYANLNYSNSLYGDGIPESEPAYYGTQSFRDGFTAYAAAIVDRYKGKNFTWEVWNEPNYGFWPGQSADQYMALANQVLPRIRTADPTATIAGPSLSASVVTENYQYLTDCFNYGNANPGTGLKGLLDLVDGVSVHPYRWDGNRNPESVVTDTTQFNYAALRTLMNDTTRWANGSNVEIVNSEWGYTTTWSGLTLQNQADYVPRMLLVNASQGVPLSIMYDLFDDGTDPDNGEHNFGMLYNDLTPKPAFYAMKTLTSTLKGTKYNRKLTDSNPNDWLTVFRSTTTNRETLAAWTTDIAGVSTVSDWGTYYLNGTPLYVGQSQTRAAGNGKWSDHSWDGGSAWISGSQAKLDTENASITVNGTYTISGFQFGAKGVTLKGGTLNFTSGGGAIHTGSNNATINTVLAGGGDPSTFSLRKSGTGSLTLGGANTFSGGVLIGEGTIKMGNRQALGQSTNPVTLAGGTLDMNGFNVAAGHAMTVDTAGSVLANSAATAASYDASVVLNAGLTANAVGNLAINGSISGTGRLTKTGSGLLTLHGTNTYSGGTTISAGNLQFATNESCPTGSITINSTGTLVADGARASAQDWLDSGLIATTSNGILAMTADASDINMRNYSSLSIGATGNSTLSGALTPSGIRYRLGGGGGTLTVSSVLSNISTSSTRRLVVNGNVTLTGANTYTGSTTVNAGNLLFASPSAHPNTSTTINAGGAVVASGAYTAVADWLNNSTGKGRINTNSQGALALAANSSEPISMGSYASLSIGATGNYTYSGELTPATANNTYRFGGGGGTLTVTGNLVDKTTSPTATRSLVVNGKVTLTGVNTYSGATTVNSGALTLSGSGSLNSLSAIALKGGVLLQNSTTPLMAPITFTSGALGGTGTYGNNLSVGSGHLSPGDGGVGTLTVAGNVSLSSNSILDYDFGATAGVCDRLTVTGDLTLDGTLNITSSDALVHGKYTLFSVYGATGVTDNGLDFGVVPAGHDWAYSIANDNGVYSVIVTAAPEPGTLILLATGLLGILAYAWRKRR